MDEDGVAGLHDVGLADEVLGGHALEHHGRGLLVADAVGQGDQHLGGGRAAVGVGAEGGGVGHALAGLHLGDAVAHGLDHAGTLVAGGEGQAAGGRVEAGAEVGVDEVEAHGRLPDQGLAGAGLAGVELLELEHLGAAMLGYPDPPGHRSSHSSCLSAFGLLEASGRPSPAGRSARSWSGSVTGASQTVPTHT